MIKTLPKLPTLAIQRLPLIAGFVMAMLLPCPAQNTPKFAGTSIPAAPAQTLPWSTPQSNLPPEAVSAMTDLFKAGLADPRECEYREIEVVTGSCWGNSEVTKTGGWVLPSPDTQKFGVCWSGIVYPLVSVGAVADLRADVLSMLKKDQAEIDKERARFDQTEKQREDEAKRQGKAYRHVDWPLRWNRNAVPEETNIATDSMRPIKAALLWRRGETELAEKVWSQWSGVTPQNAAKNSLLQLANDWVWALFDRAVCAHMRGDDYLALASAKALLPIQQDGGALVAKGNPSDLSPGSESQNNSRKSAPDLAYPYLASLPDLIADQ